MITESDITKLIDKVHDGEISKEQFFTKVEKIISSYWKELELSAPTDEELTNVEQLKEDIIKEQGDHNDSNKSS